jgi:general secretion pathway protein I
MIGQRDHRGLVGGVARGYSLLEVLVALVIFTSAGLAAITLLSQGFDTARRLEQAEASARLKLDAMSLLQSINPTSKPVGTLKEGTIELRWESEAVEPETKEFSYGDLIAARWILGLYKVRFEAERGEATTRWTQLMVGWREIPESLRSRPPVSP